jgi:HrpA-like RNA helicase
LGHFIEPLSFERAEMTADYYDAKDARPGHIAAGLDAPRPQWQRDIDEKLQHVQVCIVKAPSGQGKSTLLYRYALEHLVPNTIFRVNACASEEHA